MIIDKDGKVGIGTTSPGAPLNVVGLAGNPPVYLDVYEGTSTSQIAVRAARGTPELPTALLLGNMVGGFSARGYATTGFTAGAKGALQIRASENWTDSANGTYMSLWTTATGGTGITEKMRLQNSGGLSLGASYLTTDPGAGSMIISGNVGIGTTSPGSILDVVGTAQMTGLKLTTSPTAGYVITSDASGTGTWQAATGVTSSGSANYIPKFTSGSAIGDSAIYDSSGNIGIGTTSPSARVEIKGVNDIFQLIVRANATQSNTNPLIQLQKSDGTPFLGLVAIMIPTYLLVRIRGE